MKRKCGKCEILGYPDFELFFEYKNPLEDENRIIDAREIITFTPLKTLSDSNINADKGDLIISCYKEIERCDMMEYLKYMTKEEIAAYIDRVNDMKAHSSEMKMLLTKND